MAITSYTAQTTLLPPKRGKIKLQIFRKLIKTINSWVSTKSYEKKKKGENGSVVGGEDFLPQLTNDGFWHKWKGKNVVVFNSQVFHTGVIVAGFRHDWRLFVKVFLAVGVLVALLFS